MGLSKESRIIALLVIDVVRSTVHPTCSSQVERAAGRGGNQLTDPYSFA
jgi:hypothetical protein